MRVCAKRLYVRLLRRLLVFVAQCSTEPHAKTVALFTLSFTLQVHVYSLLWQAPLNVFGTVKNNNNNKKKQTKQTNKQKKQKNAVCSSTAPLSWKISSYPVPAWHRGWDFQLGTPALVMDCLSDGLIASLYGKT